MTIVQLSTIATSALTSAGLSSVHLESQIDGISTPESRQIGLDQVADVITADRKLVRAATSSFGVAGGSASVTGSLAINTGLSALSRAILVIRGALTSSAAAVSWSPLASAGWFSAFVYANPLSSTNAPALSVAAVTVDWIAQGTV